MKANFAFIYSNRKGVGAMSPRDGSQGIDNSYQRGTFRKGTKVARRWHSTDRIAEKGRNRFKMDIRTNWTESFNKKYELKYYLARSQNGGFA